MKFQRMVAKRLNSYWHSSSTVYKWRWGSNHIATMSSDGLLKAALIEVISLDQKIEQYVNTAKGPFVKAFTCWVSSHQRNYNDSYAFFSKSLLTHLDNDIASGHLAALEAEPADDLAKKKRKNAQLYVRSKIRISQPDLQAAFDSGVQKRILKHADTTVDDGNDDTEVEAFHHPPPHHEEPATTPPHHDNQVLQEDNRIIPGPTPSHDGNRPINDALDDVFATVPELPKTTNPAYIYLLAGGELHVMIIVHQNSYALQYYFRSSLSFLQDRF